MNENEKDEIASVIQNSAIASDPRVNRTGKDAAGMTDAFDKSVAENEAAARERFANNSAALSAYLKSQADSIPATRESIRKYEISQVADWASKKSMRNVDDMYQKFSDWSTLEVARIESEYGIAVESAKVASKAIYDEKVRMFGEGMLFSDKDNKVKVTTREECERIAKSAMEDKARLIIEGAESSRANGYSVICGNLQSLGENAHKMMIADGRSMFMSEEDAALNASSYIGKKSNELIDSYSGSGYSVLAKMLLEKYSQAGITDVYETEKNDDGSIKIDKKTGTPVFKLDAEGKPIVSKTEYNPSRRLWMSMSDLKSIRDRYDSILRKEDAAAKSRSQAIEGEAFTQIDMLMSNVSKLKYAPSLDVNGLEEVKKELFKFYELGDKDVSNAVLKHVEEIDKIIGEHPNKVYLTEENAKFMSSPQEFVDSIQEDMKNASDSVMYHCFLDDGSDAGFWMGKYQSALMKIDAGVKQGKIKLDDQVPGLDVKWKDWKKSISEEQDVYFTKMICSVLSNESGLSFYDDKETKKLAKAAGYKKPHWSAPDGRVVFDSGNANIFNAKGMVFKKRVGNTEITFTGEEVNNEIIPAAKEFLKTYQGKNRREDLVKYLWGDGGVMSKSVTRKLEKGFFYESYKSVLGPIKSVADDELVRWRKMNGRDHERFAIIYAGNQLMSSRYIDNLRKNAEEKNRQRQESKNKESKETK